jgi:benzoylformate decarboxylase
MRLAGRHAFLRILAEEGVTHLFGNPGTTELAIMEALGTHPEIRFVLGLQEAVVLAMADGYARASGRLAAANVHVAPGLGNAMGALYNARFSGSPVLLTAGQHEQGHGLREPLLYAPLVEVARPFVKWAVEVTRAEDLPLVLRRAAKVALAPPAGPVFVSLPGDVLADEAEMELGRPTRVDFRVRPSDEVLEALGARLLAARRPAILAGRELGERGAWTEAAELAELLGAAVFGETVPYCGSFPSEHPAYLGALPRNQRAVRDALAPFDLLVCLGADLLRMSVASAVDPLPPGMAVVQLCARDWELGKNHPAEIAIFADVKETLAALLPRLRARADRTAAGARLGALASRNWRAQREAARLAALEAAETKPIDPRFLMLRIAEALPAQAVVVEEALTSSLSLPAVLPLREPKSFFGLASGGLGFALPGAVGASLAAPGRPVLAVVGDGAAMYGIQALWTAAHLALPITYVVANNRSYRILKERLVSMQGSDRFVGMDLRDPEIDFVALAASMGVPARRIADPQDIAPALREALAAGAPRLLDVRVADGFGG